MRTEEEIRAMARVHKIKSEQLSRDVEYYTWRKNEKRIEDAQIALEKCAVVLNVLYWMLDVQDVPLEEEQENDNS